MMMAPRITGQRTTLTNDAHASAVGLIDVGREAFLDCRTQQLTDLVGALPEADLRRIVLALALLAGGIAARQGNRDWWNEVTSDGIR